jgi:hypothetical protein
MVSKVSVPGYIVFGPKAGQSVMVAGARWSTAANSMMDRKQKEVTEGIWAKTYPSSHVPSDPLLSPSTVLPSPNSLFKI